MLASGAGLQKLGTQGEAPALFPGEDTMLPVQGGEKTRTAEERPLFAFGLDFDI